MKIGFHFNADHESLGSYYGWPIRMEVLGKLLEKRNLNISTKIFHGDLMLISFSTDTQESINRENGSITISHRFNPDKYNQLFQAWLNSFDNNWRHFNMEKVREAANQNIFVICFESIDHENAEYIDSSLQDFAPYIGAMEIDESNKIHWLLYGNSLIPYARLTNKRLNLFYDYGSDDLDTAEQQEYLKLGFERVDFECLNHRYTVFDRHHNFDYARRIAEWKKGFGSMLAFVADDTVSNLSDIAPDLGDRLWSALTTFENAETNEQLAQVMTTCRRIFEYVTDKVFPPTDTPTESGHSLKSNKYKNRIYEYAKQSKASSTNIELITASIELLYGQWEKLNNLANKGVHHEVFRNEARRCFIRTILLLDDIISLREEPFEISPDIDLDFLFNNLRW